MFWGNLSLSIASLELFSIAMSSIYVAVKRFVRDEYEQCCMHAGKCLHTSADPFFSSA